MKWASSLGSLALVLQKPTQWITSGGILSSMVRNHQLNRWWLLTHVLGTDVTAREKQSNHGQFLMGKSPDTFCPMVSDLMSKRAFISVANLWSRAPLLFRRMLYQIR